MANRVGSEPPSPSRLPIRLVVAVVLLGTLLAWWGTRGHRRLFGEPPRKPVPAGAADVPQNIQVDSAMLARGAEINERECAGCHKRAARSSGPSYKEIVTFYRREFPDSAGDSDLRARLATAVTHPRPGWGNFAPGPAESGLSLDDRIALASWILNSVDQDKKPGEGVGK
jgi:cytochrome c551/c552